jgi:hypothetical protein
MWRWVLAGVLASGLWCGEALGEVSDEDQITLPRGLAPDESLVSSVSKPEDADVKNAGALVSQAVLTVVAESRDHHPALASP